MTKGQLAILFVALFILSSCVQSLYPLTDDEKQTVFNKGLLGRWKGDDGTEYLVESLHDKFYRVAAIEHSPGKNSGDTNHCLMTLVLIKGQYFLDCFADTTQLIFKTFDDHSAGLMVPVHFIVKLNSISSHSVELRSIDHDRILNLMQQKKLDIKYVVLKKDDVLFLEKPANLQQKLIELEKFPQAYSKSLLQHQ